MIEPIFYAGIIISLTWMIATLIVKEKKRKILMILGVVACLVLLLYTRQWKCSFSNVFSRFHTGYELGKLI